MLKTIRIDYLTINQVSIDKDSMVSKVCDSEFDKAKFDAKTSKFKNNKMAKSKGKNLIRFFWLSLKLLLKISDRVFLLLKLS